MTWSNILIGLVLFIFLINLLVRYISNIYETFQNEVIPMDASGVDLNKVANEINTLNINTTEVNPRNLNDSSKVCESLQSQINILETTKNTYRSVGDWSNVKASNIAIDKLKEQMGTLGCQNNNSQNN